MTSATPHPRLRPLEVHSIVHDERPYFLLRDPQRISQGELLVPTIYGAVLALCDGNLPAPEIASRVRTHYGLPMGDERVADLLDALDAAAMLENETYAERRAEVLADWRALESRPMALAGDGYPADPDELTALFERWLEEAAADVEPAQVDWTRGAALLSPHIDYGRGGDVYARIWKRARKAAREAEVAVIFGTDHYGSEPVTLTRVPYATPWGLLPADTLVIDAVERAVDSGRTHKVATAGELRHRGEHSLELVLNWLHHMRGGEPLPVAPILVGGLHGHVLGRRRPGADRTLVRMVTAVQRAIAGRRALIIASGDLAHVGPAFDGDPLDEEGLAALQADDDLLLERLLAGDADGFFEEIQRKEDANNVCGTAPIWLTLRTLGAGSPAVGGEREQQVEGEIVGYTVCPADGLGTSVVTVAGALFTRADA